MRPISLFKLYLCVANNEIGPILGPFSCVLFINNNKAMQMQYSDVMAEVDAGKYVIPAGWTQGRACFGGLIAAIMYRRLQALVPDRPPRSLFVSFVGPVAAGDIELNAEVLRTGGSVTQAECRSEEHTSELQSRFDLV